MAKYLKTSVTLETRTAEARLKALAKSINRVQAAVGKASTGTAVLTTHLTRAASTTDKVTKRTTQWGSSMGKVSKNANQITKYLQNSSSMVDSLIGKVKSLAAAYLGVMGARNMVNSIDTITSAENQMNYMNGGDVDTTTEQQDAIYRAAQRARTDYGDMMKGVAKSMTLAPDAFGNNMDAAIAFEEIMAKSYTLAGASASEMTNSMYQLRQALAAGKLQGDEMKSVMENAPLAYQKMEEFAQKTLKSKETLQELGSQGKVTANMIVAAMMEAGPEIEKAFQETDVTIAQVGTNFKNTWLNSLRPVQDKINEFINSAKGQKIINQLTGAIRVLGAVVEKVVGALINGAIWISENWSKIEPIIWGLVIALGALAAANAIKWAIMNAPVIAFIACIALVVKALLAMQDGASLTCESIGALFMMLAVVAAGVGLAIIAITIAVMVAVGAATGGISLLIGGIAMFVLAVLMAIAGYILTHLAETFAAYCWWQAQLNNVMARIKAGWAAVCAFMSTEWENFVNWCTAFGNALGAYFDAWGHNVQAAISDPWEFAKSAFWSWIADIFDGLKSIEPAINGIAKLFGAEGFTVSGTASLARQKASQVESKHQYKDPSAAFNSEMAAYYALKKDSVAAGLDAFNDVYTEEYLDPDLQYKAGMLQGKAIEDKINLALVKGKLKVEELMKQAEELDPKELEKKMEEIKKQAEDAVNSAGDPAAATAGNTKKMADSMELAEEDLTYLRQIAEMEWKKEFTTANIKVDMSNYNTVNGDNDLDGIVTKLTDKLYEELGAVANGVYA